MKQSLTDRWGQKSTLNFNYLTKQEIFLFSELFSCSIINNQYSTEIIISLCLSTLLLWSFPTYLNMCCSLSKHFCWSPLLFQRKLNSEQLCSSLLTVSYGKAAVLLYFINKMTLPDVNMTLASTNPACPLRQPDLKPCWGGPESLKVSECRNHFLPREAQRQAFCSFVKKQWKETFCDKQLRALCRPCLKVFFCPCVL